MLKNQQYSRWPTLLLLAVVTASVSILSDACHGQGRTESVAETQLPTRFGGELSTFSVVQPNNITFGGGFNEFGQFNGLNECDLVGSFGGRDLFITYTAGNGNDVALVSAIPEPGAAGILVLFGQAGTMQIRRKRLC